MEKTLNAYSWSEIAEIAKSGIAKNLFNIDYTKIDHMKNGDDIEYRIIGFDHDADNSITFEATNIYKCVEFSDEICIYKESNIYRYLHNEFLDLVSDDLRRNAKSVEKINLYEDSLSVSNNYFFILSEQEVFGRKIYSYGKEGKWYDYYRQKDMEYGFNKFRWCRSRYYNYPGSVCAVSSNGSAGISHYNCACGLAPAFCI